jgi:DNA-binding transcriptional regulator YhcF (GntR family)
MKRLEFYKNYSWAAVKLGGMASAATIVFSIIYSYHENGKECFLSLNEFANLIQCGRSTVQRALDQLKGCGIIWTEDCNYRNSKTYIINEQMCDYWQTEFTLSQS